MSDPAFVTSLNKAGMMAGTEMTMLNGQETPVVFVGQSGFYDMYVPPSGLPVPYGSKVIVNDAGNAAYSDRQTIYVISGGTTLPVTLPFSNASLVEVNGFNKSGRIVGTFMDNTASPAVIRVFYYNGSVISTFGSYDSSDIVTVALNDHNEMLVGDTNQDTQGVTSNYVKCTGSGC